MDHYPEVNISERECASRRSSASSNTHSLQQTSTSTSKDGNLAPPHYISFPPPPSDAPGEERSRKDSVQSTSSDSKLHPLEVELARYTDAPPPYSEKQYEGKSEDEKSRMRMVDYAKEVSRVMGRQLARGLKGEKEGKK